MKNVYDRINAHSNNNWVIYKKEVRDNVSRTITSDVSRITNITFNIGIFYDIRESIKDIIINENELYITNYF